MPFFITLECTITVKAFATCSAVGDGDKMC